MYKYTKKVKSERKTAEETWQEIRRIGNSMMKDEERKMGNHLKKISQNQMKTRKNASKMYWWIPSESEKWRTRSNKYIRVHRINGLKQNQSKEGNETVNTTNYEASYTKNKTKTMRLIHNKYWQNKRASNNEWLKWTKDSKWTIFLFEGHTTSSRTCTSLCHEFTTTTYVVLIVCNQVPTPVSFQGTYSVQRPWFITIRTKSSHVSGW